MKPLEVRGSWNEQKGKLKQKFAAITDNDLLFAEGNKEKMLAKLQDKLCITKEELRQIIAEL